MIDKMLVLQKAYNTSERISIHRNGRNNNDLQVLSYNNDMTTFLKGTKRIEIPTNEFDVNVDYTERFYRDMYCMEKVGMNFDKLASHIERLYQWDQCDEVTQIGYKYGASCAKRLDVTVNGLELVAAMTYGTVTGIRFPDGTKVRKIYSNTSSKWDYQIL